jgi:hypothetical protein
VLVATGLGVCGVDAHDGSSAHQRSELCDLALERIRECGSLGLVCRELHPVGVVMAKQERVTVRGAMIC